MMENKAAITKMSTNNDYNMPQPATATAAPAVVAAETIAKLTENTK